MVSLLFNTMIILPDNPLFQLTLQTVPPPDWQNHASEELAMIFDHESGLMRPATLAEMTDYVEGGEYDERLRSIGEFEDL